jgi:hypothetical protein
VDTLRPSPRTNQTRRVPHPVLIGHAASLTPSRDFALPWWLDHQKGAEAQYWVGMLSAKTRFVRVVNMLTKDEHSLEVCSEDTLAQIQDKYLRYNAHAGSYAWKRIPPAGGDMQLLDMAKTLEENGVRDESAEYEELGVDDDYYTPSLHLYYKDDLTVA